ncbi:LuxR C-terminal-related transcriptional regulator [Kribbella pratensis]|uniref:LuxR C-terminal-related transcriptional regulator n=1 Tax=Kribbella pratensis TaxID=2512112 RepID=UPI0010663F22
MWPPEPSLRWTQHVRRSELGTRTTPSDCTHTSSVLAATECRVAELVAAGHSNREVAAELFRSAKTSARARNSRTS